MTGIDYNDLNPESVPYFMDQIPAGASTKTILHFAQLMINGGEFLKWDYGTEMNLQVYGSEIPPKYDLTQVKVPTTMYAGDADSLIGLADVRALSKVLPNDRMHVIDKEDWGHFDFIFSDQRGELVYEDILFNLKRLDDD